VVWLQNNRTDVRTFFIQKIIYQKCCHPQSTLLPDPYTAPCGSSTVGSNTAGRLLIAYSWASLHLPSLHLRTRNLVPSNAGLIFGNKKSHMGLGQVSTVDVPTWWSCASPKTSWQTGRCETARCLGEEPMSRSSTFQVSFFSPVYESLSKPPCSRLVNGLTFRHPIHMNNPLDVKKTIITALNLDLLCFLLPWWTGALPVHGLALTFWVMLKKPWFITSYYVL